MSSTYSSSLRIELIGSGDQAGAWGATTDSNLAYIMDTAIAGYQAVPITSTAQALTYVNGPSSTANLNQSVYAMLKFTGASAATSVYIPPASKQYVVWNNTSYAITVYNSTVIGNTTAAGTGITLAAADKILIWSDGTNVYDVKAQGLTGTLAIANGGTGQTTQQAAINALAGTQTNNRVLRSDGTNTTLSQVALTTDVTGTLPVANGGTGVTTSTGSGNNVLSTSPTLVTPALGTPTSGTLTNCTFPTLNQNTTGTASNVTGVVAIANGGTGQTTQQAAINALAGTQTNNRVLRSDGTNTTLSQVALTTDVTGTLPLANGGTGVTSLAALGNLFYPVGSIYSNAANATNPGTLLGFGTWSAFGAGRVMIGNGGGFSAGATGGSADAVLVSHSHTASVSDPTHAHTSYVPYSNSLGSGVTAFLASKQTSPDYSQATSAVATGITVSNSTEGVSATNANLQPYIVVYMWQRTA